MKSGDQTPSATSSEANEQPLPTFAAYVNAPSYKGVGGWLLFLCITLTMLNPLFTLLGIFIGFQLIEGRVYESDFKPYLYFDAALSLTFAGYGVYAGISLWSLRPNAVTVAKIYLIVRSFYALAIAVLLLTAGVPVSLGSVSLGISICGLWLNYLTRSERVKATYEQTDAGDHHFTGLGLGG